PSTRCPPPSCNATHNALTSSPTRRSSDLDENGRGGAPALHRQPRQAVDVPPLRVVRLAAAQTEPELPRHEPERHAGRRFDAVRAQGDSPDLELAVVRLEAELTVAGRLPPALGIVLDPALERESIRAVRRDRRGQEPQPLAGCVLVGILVAQRVFDARRHVVDPALQHRQPLALVAQPDRVVLLPTRTAEVDGIEPPRLIARQELLTIEDDPALAGAIERRVGDASAADELVELEREERLASTATRAGPVAFRRRRDEEEFPQGLGAPVLRTS